MPVTSPVARNPASVSAVTPREATVLSRAPALNTATQPTATAGLFGDSPVSTPPAAPMTIRLAALIRSRPSDTIQVIHAATDTPSMTAIATLRGPPVVGPGRASDTGTATTTTPAERTASMIRAAVRSEEHT